MHPRGSRWFGLVSDLGVLKVVPKSKTVTVPPVIVKPTTQNVQATDTPTSPDDLLKQASKGSLITAVTWAFALAAAGAVANKLIGGKGKD